MHLTSRARGAVRRLPSVYRSRRLLDGAAGRLRFEDHVRHVLALCPAALRIEPTPVGLASPNRVEHQANTAASPRLAHDGVEQRSPHAEVARRFRHEELREIAFGT